MLGKFLLFSLSLGAADFSGIWVGLIPGRLGEVDVAFQFIQKGAVLGGKIYGEYQSTPIASGTVSGDLVTFVVVAPEQAGNQINDTRLRFTGRLIDGQIELTRERESSTNAGNRGGAPSRFNARQTFRLKRLL